MSREAMQKATFSLGLAIGLIKGDPCDEHREWIRATLVDAANTLAEELAKPAQEPVARVLSGVGFVEWLLNPCAEDTLLYETPQPISEDTKRLDFIESNEVFLDPLMDALNHWSPTDLPQSLRAAIDASMKEGEQE